MCRKMKRQTSSPPVVKASVKIHIQNYLSKRFLEKLLPDQTGSPDAAKQGAQSLLVFVQALPRKSRLLPGALPGRHDRSTLGTLDFSPGHLT